MSAWDCQFGNFGSQIEKAGFSKVDITEIDLSFKGIRFYGPMWGLSPHIFGFAVKWDTSCLKSIVYYEVEIRDRCLNLILVEETLYMNKFSIYLDTAI